MKTTDPCRARLFVCSTALGLTCLSASPAFAQAAVAVPPAEPPIAAPAPPPAAAPEAPPPAQPAPEAQPPVSPGYPYGPPPAYYYRPYYHYRAMPYAYPPPPPVESMEGFHTHDGFFMRLHVGIGGTGFSSSQAGVKTNYSGDGFSSGIAIGGAIARNWILYGTIFGIGTSNPNKTMGGANVISDFGSINVGAIGPGVAYYFEHLNLYLSAAFGVAGFTADDTHGTRGVDSSRSGTALELMVGKEWWVSANWGMGIAGEFVGASMTDKNTPGLTWSASSLSVLLSATYN